jgi:pimeloyl-ACP methyl ester carboxylesterase
VILGTHSYGSVLGRSLATLHPTTGADAYILTALITNETGISDALATFQARAASQANPFEFSSLPQGYVSITTPPIRDSLYSYPSDFSAGILAYDQVLPHIFAAGEVIAQAPLETSPSNFTGPVMVVTGRYDQIVCGVGNFTKEVADCGIGETSIPAGTKVFFPKASNFKAYVPDHTGHNLNTHFSAGETFGAVHQWLEGAGF